MDETGFPEAVEPWFRDDLDPRSDLAGLAPGCSASSAVSSPEQETESGRNAASAR